MKTTMNKGSPGVMGTGGSMKQMTSTGSGSRPGKGRFPIASSAPTEQHELHRAPSGWLK